jgi:phosphoglycolate phosphatase
MTKAFDLIVFDWDGTLMDSTAHIVAAIQAASQQLGLPIPEADQARQVIGLSLAEALASACPELPAERYAEMAQAYRQHFFVGDETVVLFDGVAQALQTITAQGITLAVATGKSRRGLNRALEVSGLHGNFAATRTQDDCPSKPHPAMLLELMTELDATPERTLRVGDTTHDLLMAQQAGTHAVGLCQGAHSREALASYPNLGLFDDFCTFDLWLRQQIC